MRPSEKSIIVSLHPLGLIWGVSSAGPQAESHASEAGSFQKFGGQSSPWVSVQKRACLHLGLILSLDLNLCVVSQMWETME